MQNENMMNLPSLHLYVLGHPDRKQAAWVRAGSITEASARLAQKSDIPVIVASHYGWVLFPGGHQHPHDEDWPVPNWEYRLAVRGPAALRGMPEYIRTLRENVPKRQGGVSIGREFARSPLIDVHRIPEASVVSTQVFHSGNTQAYRIAASEMSGYKQNPDHIEIGKEASLYLTDEEVKYPAAGDIVKVRLKGDGSDYVVTGQVAGKSILVSVVSIERLR